MEHSIDFASLNRYGKIAGIIVLIITILGPISMMVIPSALVTPGDAGQTAQNIIISKGLLRFGIFSDSLIFIAEIILTIMLYLLMKPVSNSLSLIAASARLAMTVIQGANVINYFLVLILVSGETYLLSFTMPQLHSLILVFMNLHESVTYVWGIFFATHLLFIGFLVVKSGYIPRFVGSLLIVSSVCYFIQCYGNVFIPESKAILSILGMVSIVELALPIWLLVKGVKPLK